MTSDIRFGKLHRTHNVDAFDCGVPELNIFLSRHALQSQQSGAAQTYLALEDDLVVGYYSLAASQIERANAAERLAKGLARHPVPVILLARLAVSIDVQGQGLGDDLIRDAVLRTIQASDIAGVRALVVHAKGDDARSFYEHYGFARSPTDSYHLFMLIKDLRKIISG